MVNSVRKALEQQNASKDESVVEAGEVKDKVKIKTFQRKKSMRTDMPGLAEQLKVGIDDTIYQGDSHDDVDDVFTENTESLFHGRHYWFKSNDYVK